MKKRIAYYYRGMIERTRRGGRCCWYEGFSANGEHGGPLYPWMTKTECRANAKSQKSTAVFVRERTVQ
jgi:hypothetical protein